MAHSSSSSFSRGSQSDVGRSCLLQTSSSSIVGDVHFSVYSQFVNELHLASAS
ncbi:hypothetical protein Scep_019573 [Stephania cephalantha]|uniref:Uncharacterized protein n=1 Tax=Stephania cephalantha TaxID=152367 RepID=A0AAP0IAW8_9MAGN